MNGNEYFRKIIKLAHIAYMNREIELVYNEMCVRNGVIQQ